MPADLEPPELQQLVDAAERPRVDDWSLRSALVRYAQPEPERASAVLSLVRRIEWALQAHTDVLRRDGAELWSDVSKGAPPTSGPAGFVVELLTAMMALDRLGDELARWAVDRASGRPDAEVDAVTSEVARRIDAIGVPKEDGPPPSSRR